MKSKLDRPGSNYARRKKDPEKGTKIKLSSRDTTPKPTEASKMKSKDAEIEAHIKDQARKIARTSSQSALDKLMAQDKNFQNIMKAKHEPLGTAKAHNNAITSSKLSQAQKQLKVQG